MQIASWNIIPGVLHTGSQRCSADGCLHRTAGNSIVPFELELGTKFYILEVFKVKCGHGVQKLRVLWVRGNELRDSCR